MDNDAAVTPLFAVGDNILHAVALDTREGLVRYYYRVDQVIQPSHFTEVYLCTYMPGNMPVTIKTVRSWEPARKNAFRHEGVVSLALRSHPNVNYCLTVEQQNGMKFLVLERPPREVRRGTDLEEWLRSGPFPLRQSLELTLDICRGLRHANQMLPGFVHRDIKPANILMKPRTQDSGEAIAQICDFGLALYRDADAGILMDVEATSSLQIGRANLHAAGVGSRPYMAPEQWRDDALDATADLYAVGCVLYEMLTGHPPFQVNYTLASCQVV